MRRRLPVLNTLRAFEAAARHGSFTRAAEELCLTQGAISHQVKALEDELGVKLFNREHQRLVITQAGRAYLVEVGDALDRIAIATERIVERQRSGALTISTSPDFAAKWLVHRLGKFAQSHPEIDLRLSAAMHRVDFAREDVDVAVRHGKGDWEGLHVERLCAEQLFPVCSPRLVEAGNLTRPADILKFPLLHLDTREDWAVWLDSAGVAGADVSRGSIMNHASMLIDAAIDGQGIALARTVLAAWDLVHGRLVRPFAQALPLSRSYWIVCPKATASLPKIRTFNNWLLAEAAEDVRRVDGLS
jgi:LysR family transcriptional regulator, glycine cleavage system transcriptional activator